MIPTALVGLVAIIIGRVVGERIAKRLDAERLRRIIYIFVGISGAVTLVSHLP